MDELDWDPYERQTQQMARSDCPRGEQGDEEGGGMVRNECDSPGLTFRLDKLFVLDKVPRNSIKSSNFQWNLFHHQSISTGFCHSIHIFDLIKLKIPWDEAHGDRVIRVLIMRCLIG